MDIETASLFIYHLMYCDVADHDKARLTGMIIYEAPAIRSGFVSASLIDSHGFRVSGPYCEEHFHSRQRSGQIMVDLFNNGALSLDVVRKLIHEFCQVHLVTSEENIRLVPYQNRLLYDKPWQEQYQAAGIKLLPDPGTAPIYYYKQYDINGVRYDNIRDASRSTNTTYDEIRRRCSSKAKVWEQWMRKAS